ncbi:hypothetical protein CBS147332_7608 [Penicillium roqueforti]|nr:hypothetical protein CBS147332_7608 [Penicillium roqueforti]KAI3102987.1 hypothetical protein CBS147331_7635 [Penicillium roqueforti]
MASASEAAFAYHEPSIKTVLSYTSFLLTLNIANTCLDKLHYCGFFGQLFIGVLWGTPGAQWIDQETERVIQQIGYLGLILLIYESGLSTSIQSLKANILLSTAVAITGSFAAGAALSATSLGTTFTILSTTQLTTTRLGTVTTSAAMLDDVVGLVMVQIISNLGGSATSFTTVTVIRPVLIFIGFATCVLVGIVAGATYAGTSSLFAAYLAGVIVSWFDGLIAEAKTQFPALRSAESHGKTLNEQSRTRNCKDRTEETPSSPTQPPQATEITPNDTPTGELIYAKYYKEPVNRILLPLFFASIGFAIPITKMFSGQVKNDLAGAILSEPCVASQKKKGPQIPATQDESADVPAPDNAKDESQSTNRSPAPTFRPDSRISLPPKPKSLYPPSLLGLAMVARGEVGYLIASIAESKGIFSNDSSEGPSDIYLVVIWAISLCTLIGPILVGTLVKRVKKLQQSRVNMGLDPLGVWGI